MDNMKEWARSKTIAEMPWSSGNESVLGELRLILVALFEGTKFSVKRNPTESECCVNIYCEGEVDRIGYIYPKARFKLFDFVLSNEFVDKLRPRMELPADMDVKKGKVYNSRQYRIPVEKVVEIAECLAHCC